MNPITNSPIKEAMRQHYHSIASDKETQITCQLNKDCIAIDNETTNRINSMKPKEHPSGYACVAWMIILGIIFAALAAFPGFVFGAFAGVAIFFVIVVVVDKSNKELEATKRQMRLDADRKKEQLQNNAAAQIRAAYIEADRRTQQDINRYDAEVKRNCQAILQKASSFSAMLDHVVNMFQRMVSHADSSSNKKFVETYFIYKVDLYGISYKYNSTYSNPKDDFNFDKQRYRNLVTKEECEGLAQAIAKMTISKMKSIYPPNSLNLNISHIDAEVTIHFKAANKNYVPPRDIY